MGKSLFMGRLKIALVFAILTIAPLFKNLYLVIPLLMAILQKCLGTFASFYF